MSYKKCGKNVYFTVTKKKKKGEKNKKKLSVNSTEHLMDSKAELLTFLAFVWVGFSELWIPEAMKHVCQINMFLSWEFSSTVERA